MQLPQSEQPFIHSPVCFHHKRMPDTQRLSINTLWMNDFIYIKSPAEQTLV